MYSGACRFWFPVMIIFLVFPPAIRAEKRMFVSMTSFMRFPCSVLLCRV